MWLSHQIIHIPPIVPLKVVNHGEYMIYKNRIEVIIFKINRFLRFYCRPQFQETNYQYTLNDVKYN